jgi:drug/metabolite transporter (DMT)-like permease
VDRRLILFLLVASNLLWAGTYVAGKVTLHSLSPVELNAARFTLAGLLFLPFLLRSQLDLTRERLLRLAWLCLFGFVLNKAAEFSGLALTTASDTALLIAAEGLFTALFGWLLLRENLDWRSVLGMGLSVIGVYLVVQRGLHWPALDGGTRVIGDLLVMAALALEAVYSVLGKVETERSPAVVVTGACVIGSLSVWLPAAAVNLTITGVPSLGLGAVAGLLYLAIAGTFLAYLGWIVALRHVDATVAAPMLFLQPLAGTLLAVLLLHERVLPITIIGGVLIIAGISIVSTKRAQAEGVVISTEVVG